MKVIGLIGGTSYESMTTYYRILNTRVNQLLGAYHSAKLVIVSLDFNEIVTALYENRWGDVEKIVLKAAQQLARAGVDAIALCCNTLHKVVPAIEQAIHLPFLHILAPTGQAIKKQKISKIGLLGTQFTMNDGFYSHYLYDYFQIESITPHSKDKERLNTIILNELCYGIIENDSRQTLLQIINALKANGTQGIVLGCTELYMLLSESTELNIPIFDTTAIHAKAIVDYALQT